MASTRTSSTLSVNKPDEKREADDRSMSDDNNDSLAQPAPTRDPADEETGAEEPPSPASKPEKDAFLVEFDDGDPLNPRNWNKWYKGFVTFQLGMLALCGSLGSSIISPASNAIQQQFNVSQEVTVLNVSLYVLGFALGPSLWAPISEVYGRKVSILPAVFVLGLFAIGSGASKSLASLLITRLFGGIFGSAPISNVSAALGDMYAPGPRGIAVTFYAVAVVGGPTIGPVIGSALTGNPALGWRWTEYISAIWTFTVFFLSLFALPEVFSLVLLKRKAASLRKTTGDERYWHPHEKQKITLSNIVTKHLSRPVKMLLTEPMVTAIAIYASFVYGLLYMTLELFPIVFVGEYHFGLIVSTLPFLGLMVGVLASLVINLANVPRYQRIVAQNNGKAVPEARLQPMQIGGLLFVIGLFWFGWTANPRIHWAVPTVATGFIGAGFNIIFQQCINFLVDTYGLYAASAVSANTVLRSLLACALPLAAKPLFHNLGIGGGSSLLGGLACLALPIPFLFQRYGLKLRKMSKFAPADD